MGGAIPFNDFMPDSIDKCIEVLNLHGGNPVYINLNEKALQHQLKQLTRKERTHRLCTRGGMLESFLQEPERLTDDDVMLLLKLIFHRQDTQELLKKLLEREKPETP